MADPDLQPDLFGFNPATPITRTKVQRRRTVNPMTQGDLFTSGKTVKLKFCIKCQNDLPLSAFSRSSVNRDGYRGECRKCGVAYSKRYRQTEAGRQVAARSRLCAACTKHFSLREGWLFGKCCSAACAKALALRDSQRYCARPGCPNSISHKHGSARWCSETCRNICRGQTEEHKQYQKKYAQQYNQRPEIKERNRKKVREWSKTDRGKAYRDEYNRKYYQREEIKERRRQYENSPDRKEYKRQYQQLPERKEYGRNYMKERYANDPEFRQRCLENAKSPERKEYAKRYYYSPERQAALKKYYQSSAFKERLKQYRQTPEFKEWRNAYDQSDKRKQYIAKRYHKRKNDPVFKEYRRRYSQTPERKAYSRNYRIKLYYGFDTTQIPPRPNKCENPHCDRTKVSVDHDHLTGAFRGWLCQLCNSAAGMSGDNSAILRWLASYLEISSNETNNGIHYKEYGTYLYIDNPTNIPPMPSECSNQHCKNTKIVLDHDHISGNFRGWICTQCNTALGFCKDNPAILRWLADYLERHSQAQTVGEVVGKPPAQPLRPPLP
jgi:hypothetical protein